MRIDDCGLETRIGQSNRNMWTAMRIRNERSGGESIERRALLLVVCIAVSSGAGWNAGGGGAAAISLGINYGKVANNLPAPAEVVTLIQSIPITKAKLYDTDPLVLQTFGNTGISFVVGISNDQLLSLTNPSVALSWVQQNIVAYLPNTNIIGIVVGNEIFSDNSNPQLMPLVLPAMKNIRSALSSLGLQNSIAVSTAHSFAVLSNSYPPSAGAFKPEIAQTYMKPILDFLSETGTPFMINVYPFFAYIADPATVSLDYVLFRSNSGFTDPTTGLHYDNMFDAQMDAAYCAMAALGQPNLTMIVSETGWPSAGDADEPGATVANAQTYHTNLIKHLGSNKGTPLRPNSQLEVYIFALFNENLKPGPTSERNYGLFWPDGTKVYTFDITEASSVKVGTVSSSPMKVAPLQMMYLCCLLISLVNFFVR